MLYRLSFQQLVNVPMHRAEVATTEELNLINLTRLLPTLDWAVTLGFLAQKALKDYTQADIERACSELEKHSKEVNQAVLHINEEPPNACPLPRLK